MHLLPPPRGLIALIKEAASISETSVNFCQTTQCNISEDNHHHIRRRENLKSQLCLKEVSLKIRRISAFIHHLQVDIKDTFLVLMAIISLI
jgi:hypothetical protein